MIHFEELQHTRQALLLRLQQLLIIARKQELPERLKPLFPESGNVLTKHTYDLVSEPEIESALQAVGRTQFADAETSPVRKRTSPSHSRNRCALLTEEAI